MPRSRPFRITSAYIEALHDEGISVQWAGVEPVGRFDCLDLNLLESASQQPFQGGFGVDEFYPTVYEKAACLFFSIAGGHIFSNGNKRTAVLALDQFLIANGIYLILSNEEMRRLAEATASHGERNEADADVMAQIAKVIRGNALPFAIVKRAPGGKKTYAQLVRSKRLIRGHALNRSDARPRQAVLRGVEPGRSHSN